MEAPAAVASLNPDFVTDYSTGGMIGRLRHVADVLSEIAPKTVTSLMDSGFDGSTLLIDLDDFTRFFAERGEIHTEPRKGRSVRHWRLWRGVVVLAIEWMPVDEHQCDEQPRVVGPLPSQDEAESAGEQECLTLLVEPGKSDF